MFKIYCLFALDMINLALYLSVFQRHIILLGGSYSLMGLMTSICAVLSLIWKPIAGHLSDIKGNTKLLMFCLTFSAVGNILAASATSLFIYFISRIICVMGSPIQSLIRMKITDIAGPNDATTIFNKIGAMMGFSFLGGTLIGGKLSEFQYGISYTYLLMSLHTLIGLKLTMRYALTLVTLILGAVVTAAPPSSQNDAFDEFANGNRIFTARAYKELVKEQTGNIIMSPFSAETVLAMTYEGARGQTAREFETGLSLPSTKSKTQEAFKNFLPLLQSSNEDLKLLSANKIYAAQDVKLEPKFLEVAENVYNSAVENVDFSRNTEAVDIINRWVESQTNNRIKNLIRPESIDASTRLVLVNALYFNGKWEYPFDSHYTTPDKFYKTKNDSSAIEVETMHQTDDFKYCQTLDAKYLELPYEDSDVSMVIVLPHERDGLKDLEANLEDVLKPQNCYEQRVEVALPKFTIDTTIPFIPILIKLGITQAFGSGSDLSGLSSTDKNIVISEVIQKAFIKVNEAGTEAAAATAVLEECISVHAPPAKFFADHPFFYEIKYRGITLFTGRVTHPEV